MNVNLYDCVYSVGTQTEKGISDLEACNLFRQRH